MTRPAWRGRGLFPRLVEAVTAGAAATGAAGTLYAPSNPDSRRPLERLGMRAVGDVRVWVRPVDTAWLARRGHLPSAAVRAVSALTFRSPRASVPTPATEVPDVVARAAPPATGVDRHAAFWEWRYLRHPDAPYTLLATRTDDGDAAAAVRVREAFGARFLHVLDATGDTPAAVAALVAGLPAAFPQVDGVAAIAVRGSDRAAKWSAAGLRSVPPRLAPSTLAVGVLAADADATRHLAAHDWDVSWADLDHL